MATNFGTLLKVNTSGSYVTVGSITKIDIPEVVTETIEITNHASTYREYEASGLVGLSEFKTTLNITDEFTLLTEAVAGSALALQIAFPNDLGEWSFNGVVKGFKLNEADAQSPNALQAEVTIQPSGALAVT